MLLSFALVAQAVQRPGESPPIPIAPLRFALFVVPVAALLNALLSHFGETVLLRLPPRIPIVGGAITAEALVYGATNGLVLAALFAAFAVLNLAVPVRDLIRFVPKAFYPVAVVISIAVSFVPTTLRQLQQIREAQAVRGHRMRGLRDWLPLFMPLLVGGLERAFQLAEAMTARGFAESAAIQKGAGLDLTQFGLIVGLALLLGGALLRIIWGYDVWGWVLLLAGSLAVLLVLWWRGHQVVRTTYRQRSWSRQDWGVLIGAAVALLGLWGFSQTSRAYAPYPQLSLPPFNPWTGIALLGFLAPLVARDRGCPLMTPSQSPSPGWRG